ncbi:MAG TPA: translation initiation factor IF-3 [Epulopiscium sp.]|nr:translation initiation factor IF-3 [Candidatus Epulonipiscium sp.]
MINEQIREKEVRLVGLEGEQIGVTALEEAQRLATEAGVDLVMIAPKAKPPVCKIMDFGKHKFDIAKREKEARKKQKTISVKEVRFSASIEKHDFDTKLRNAEKFLKAGDKVKVSVMFRGREMMHTQSGRTLLEEAAKILEEFGDIEQRPRFEGRSMVIMVAPK